MMKKILYYFRELDTPMYRWQRLHFFDELKRREYADIETVNPLNYGSKDEAADELLQILKKRKDIDYFLTCVGDEWIEVSTIREIKKLGIPVILVCWDNLELPFNHKIIASEFDLVWLTSRETEYKFRSWNCKNIVFQTYACNPFLYSPTWSETKNALGFIGSPYGSRVNKINTLLKNGVPCSLYSDSLFLSNYNTSEGEVSNIKVSKIIKKAFNYSSFLIGQKVLFSTILNKLSSKSQLNLESPFLEKNPSVSDSEMINLYSNFKLSLNITELRDTYILKNPIHKIHLRTFEIPMCGGLQIASYTDELASYFVDEKEIVLYKSDEELIDKCNFYLRAENATTVQKIKQAARRRAEGDHSWYNRFSSVLNSI